MSNQITVAQYLDRIGLKDNFDANLETLRKLSVAHMTKVPFENLDIALGKSVVLEGQVILNKVVNCRRGGFCYELNYAFGWLLKQLGFNVCFLGAWVKTRGKYGPPLDHMLLLVDLEEQGKWIADVGFGDSFIEPLPLNGEVQTQMENQYQLVKTGELQNPQYEMHRQKPGEAFEPRLRFDLTRYQLANFEQMCHFQQTSPESGFSYKSICSIATADGRKTISNGRYIVTQGSERTEQNIATAEQLQQLLLSEFGVALWDGAPLQSICIDRYSNLA